MVWTVEWLIALQLLSVYLIGLFSEDQAGLGGVPWRSHKDEPLGISVRQDFLQARCCSGHLTNSVKALSDWLLVSTE